MGKVIRILSLMAFALSANHAVAGEAPVCESADHCVWIMENHGPHEFDYNVLTEELEGFGAEGKEFLIMLIGDKDADIAGRAMDILNAGRFGFSREDARGLLKEWPGSNVEKLANLMVKIGSPNVQGRMIESLTHEDPRARTAARSVLNQMRENRKVYQVRSFEYGPVAKAVIENPTQELVQMLAVFPPDKTRPIFIQALKSGNSDSVIAAYGELFAIDKETAFQALLKTLRGLSDKDGGTAMALGALLRHRHKSRSDGFYMQFSKELAEDPKMSLMGRVAGLEAILGGQAYKDGNAPITLMTTPTVLSAFKAALSTKNDQLHPYETNFVNAAKGNPAKWANLLWAHIKNGQQVDAVVYQKFFTEIQQLEGSHRIILEALNQTENINILRFALGSAVRQNDAVYMSSVQNLTEHWADDIRYWAQAAKQSLAGEIDHEKIMAFAKTYRTIKSSDKVQIKACRVKGKSPIDFVRQLPFFTLEEEVSDSYLKRRYISSVYPTQSGWLTGFDQNKNSGGIWYFDNESGLGQNINPDRFSFISAIIPIRTPPPGQYASDFWVITADTDQGKEGRLFRVHQSDEETSSVFFRFLPKASFDVTLLPNDQYLLKHKDHSPLILTPNGQIKSACK